MRPAGKARRPRILAIFEGGATQPAGMQRWPNAQLFRGHTTRDCHNVMVIPAVFLGVMLSLASPVAQSRPEHDLLDAARLAQLERAKELLAAGADVNVADWRGFTPLMWASAAGNAALVRSLLDAGAVPDRRATDGTTALMLAAANGFVDVVRLLLSRGADAAVVKGGATARQLAAGRGHQETATLLEETERLGARLIQAVAEGQNVLVRQLLALGAPSSYTNEQGESALMIAARNGDLGTLQYLLSRGADALVRDRQGHTVFDWAERSPSTGKYVVAFLRDRGVRPELPRQIAPSQTPPVTTSLRALEVGLSRVPPASGALRAAHRRATTALSQLVALSTRWPAESPEDYRLNLAEDVRSLDAALGKGDAAGLADTLLALADDLEIKLEHCLKSGGKLGGAVTVRVRTVLGAEEAKSWQVFYMPKVLEASDTASPDLFPQLSSPTEEALVPGRYIMWLRNPTDGKLGDRTVVKVGDGKKELLLDFPVPPATGR